MNTTDHLSKMPLLPPLPPASQQTSLDEDEIQSVLVSAFGQMAGGLLLTAAVSFLFAWSGAARVLFQIPVLAFVLLLAQVGVAVVFGARMGHMKASSLRLLFGGYSVLTGITFSSLAEVYTGTTIFAAFVISALYFGCLVFIGLTTKKNLDSLGLLCVSGLVILLVSQLLLLVFGVPLDIRLYCIAGLVLFAGITAWDVSRMKTILSAEDSRLIPRENWAVYFALELYLDFINIFLYILRLFSAGAGSSSRK